MTSRMASGLDLFFDTACETRGKRLDDDERLKGKCTQSDRNIRRKAEHGDNVLIRQATGLSSRHQFYYRLANSYQQNAS